MEQLLTVFPFSTFYVCTQRFFGLATASFLPKPNLSGYLTTENLKQTTEVLPAGRPKMHRFHLFYLYQMSHLSVKENVCLFDHLQRCPIFYVASPCKSFSDK